MGIKNVAKKIAKYEVNKQTEKIIGLKDDVVALHKCKAGDVSTYKIVKDKCSNYLYYKIYDSENNLCFESILQSFANILHDVKYNEQFRLTKKFGGTIIIFRENNVELSFSYISRIHLDMKCNEADYRVIHGTMGYRFYKGDQCIGYHEYGFLKGDKLVWFEKSEDKNIFLLNAVAQMLMEIDSERGSNN